MVLVSRVRFPEQEDSLYIKFIYRRQIQGLLASDQWLKDEFDKEMSLIQKRHLTSQETQKLEMEDHWLQQVEAINSEQKCIKVF